MLELVEVAAKLWRVRKRPALRNNFCNPICGEKIPLQRVWEAWANYKSANYKLKKANAFKGKNKEGPTVKKTLLAVGPSPKDALSLAFRMGKPTGQSILPNNLAEFCGHKAKRSSLHVHEMRLGMGNWVLALEVNCPREWIEQRARCVFATPLVLSQYGESK